MKRITFFMAALVLTVVAWAGPVVGMSGTYKVGTSEVSPNFTSLKAATDALNATGMSGDVIFEISSDLLETASSRIGVDTKTFSLTIRPDSDTDRKIEFNMATDNAKASGLIIVGLSGDSWENLSSTTQNVTIDGYATGFTTRRLTLATTDAANIFHGPIQIVGSSKYITVKNCILTQRNLTSGSTTYAIRIRVEQNAALVAFRPSEITIENNVITAVKNNAQMGIGLTFGTGIAVTNTIRNVLIKNNEIFARTRGVSMSNNEDIVISNNLFSTEQTNAGMLSTWIQGISNGAGKVTVTANKFISGLTGNSTSGAYGFRGIIASGGGTWYIDNNFFTGLKTTAVPVNPGGLTDMLVIRCGNTCLIRNNTFLLNALNANVNLTPTYQAINIAAGTPEIQNNILISNEDAVTNTLISGTVGGVTDYNIYYLKAGNAMARINSTYTTLNDYQAANPTKDIHSKSVDVNFVDAATGDLRITGVSEHDDRLAVPRLIDVLTDMFGTTREAYTYAGAHEAVMPFYWTSITTPEVTARIMKTSSGIEVELDGEANIELYTINGILIEKTKTSGSYSRDLNSGIYIIRVNGKATKFIK
jgi:hypothetical protein